MVVLARLRFHPPSKPESSSRQSCIESESCFDLSLSSRNASPGKLALPSDDFWADLLAPVSSGDGSGTRTISVPDQWFTSASTTIHGTQTQAAESSQPSEVVSPDGVDWPLRPNPANEESLTEDWFLPGFPSNDSKYFPNEALNQCNAFLNTNAEILASLTAASAHRPPRLDKRALDSLSDAMSSVSLKDCKTSTLSNFSSVYGSKSLFRLGNSGASQSTRSSGPEMTGPFNTSVDSELREARRQGPILMPRSALPMPAFYWEDKLLEYAKNGDHWLTSFVMGFACRGYRDIDINYRSPSSGKTAFMIAVEYGNYETSLDMMRWELPTYVQQWTLISTRDNHGKTVLDLVACREEMFIFTHFMERVLAIVCCSCPSGARRGSICEWIAHTKLTDRHGVTLQGPVKYQFRAGCLWGEKLRRSNWLQTETLKEIDEWMVQRRCSIDDYYMARVDIECRDSRRILRADETYFRTLSNPA